MRVTPDRCYSILVVDNEPAIARVVARILGRMHAVESCVDVDRACAMVRRGITFDVILCDMLMPGKTGPDFHRYVERFAPDLADRIVFITGAAGLPSSRDFFEGIPNPTLEKPFTSTALINVVVDVARRSPVVATG